MEVHRCSICGLEFTTPELAESCRQWCAAHNSCNLEIGRLAINRDSILGFASAERAKKGQT